jgi:hypothetical protein
MSSKSILNICLKVTGVYYALSALNMLPSGIAQIVLFWDSWKYTTNNDPLKLMINYKSASLVGLLIPILLFLFAVLIIVKSEKITNFLLRKEEPLNNAGLNDVSITFLNFSIKIFGFFSLLSSIPYVSDLLSNYWVMRENLKLYDNTGKIKLASSGISIVLYVCIGLILIFYSRGIAHKLLRTESKSTKEIDTTET